MFESFWSAYPRRSGANPKWPARKLFDAFVKAGVDPKEIIAGAIVCANVDKEKIGTVFIPMAQTWLRQRRWEDYALNIDPQLPPEISEAVWKALLDREKRTGQWPSKMIHKSEIPSVFIAEWQASNANIAQEAPE